MAEGQPTVVIANTASAHASAAAKRIAAQTSLAIHDWSGHIETAKEVAAQGASSVCLSDKQAGHASLVSST